MRPRAKEMGQLARAEARWQGGWNGAACERGVTHRAMSWGDGPLPRMHLLRADPTLHPTPPRPKRPKCPTAVSISPDWPPHAHTGSTPRVLQRVGGPGTFRELSWSPDGTRIAYTENPRVGKIRIVSLKTGRDVELSTGLPPDMGYSQVAWSPDGKKIAFVAAQPERDHFWLISDFLPGRR